MEENFSMEWNMEENFSKEWNMEWKIFGMEWKWNGRKLPYGIWKNRLPFHSIPCPASRHNLTFGLLHVWFWLQITLRVRADGFRFGTGFRKVLLSVRLQLWTK